MINMTQAWDKETILYIKEVLLIYEHCFNIWGDMAKYGLYSTFLFLFVYCQINEMKISKL